MNRAVFLAFKEVLDPLMLKLAPDWLLEDMRLIRDVEPVTMNPRVRIELIMKPLGSIKEGKAVKYIEGD